LAFSARTRDGELLEGTSVETCLRALSLGAIRGNLGAKREPLRYNVVEFVSRSAKGSAHLGALVGLDRDMSPLWKGNHVDLDLVTPDEPGLVEMTDALLASAAAVEADWGVVGGPGIPELSPAGPGTPGVGWITYLSNRHGEPPRVAAPANAFPVGSGFIVVSQPGSFSESRRADLENLLAVRAAFGPRVLQLPPLPLDLTDAE
jgi:hypothetical protein